MMLDVKWKNVAGHNDKCVWSCVDSWAASGSAAVSKDTAANSDCTVMKGKSNIDGLGTDTGNFKYHFMRNM